MDVPDSLSTLPCNLCASRDITVVSRRSRSGKPLRTVACKACGLVWSDPRPQEARQFYTEDYRLAYKGTFAPKDKHVLRAGRVALDRLEMIRPHLRAGMKVLDVGSGGGEFAYLLQLLGHHVVGVEPNHGYAEYSQKEYGLQVRRGFIGEVELPSQAFDVVTIWHVLEHTEDPGAVLRRLHAVLRPGGTLVVEVPNVEATCQSPRSSFHEAHLYTFSRRTLEGLAAKCGFSARELALSPDGGNITAILKKDEAQSHAATALRIPCHHDQVISVIARHTPLSHALSPHPWRRAARRFRRMAGEAFALAGGNTRDAAALLRGLYAPDLEEAQQSPPAARPRWAWVAGAYALAVAAEEILLDQVIPRGSLGPAELMALYFGLQCAVVGSLLWLFGIVPQTGREALKVGAWAAPLFLVPAVC